MEHERVPLTADEVRELQRLEDELAGIDTSWLSEADSPVIGAETRAVGARRLTKVSFVVAASAIVVVIATFSASVFMAFAAYVAAVFASIVLIHSLVSARWLAQDDVHSTRLPARVRSGG